MEKGWLQRAQMEYSSQLHIGDPGIVGRIPAGWPVGWLQRESRGCCPAGGLSCRGADVVWPRQRE